jgi:hypothetical protein
MSVNGNYLYERTATATDGPTGGKTKTRFFTVDQLENLVTRPHTFYPYGLAGATEGVLTNSNLSGYTFADRVPLYEIDESLDQVAMWPWPERTVGERLKSIRLGVGTASTQWILGVYAWDRNTMTKTLIASGSETSAGTSAQIDEVEFIFSDPLHVIESQPYFFGLIHNSVGDIRRIYWVEITTQVISVENAVGIID